MMWRVWAEDEQRPRWPSKDETPTDYTLAYAPVEAAVFREPLSADVLLDTLGPLVP